MTIWPRPVHLDCNTDTIWLAQDLQVTYEHVQGESPEEVFSARWHRHDIEHTYPRTAPSSYDAQAQYVNTAFEIFRAQLTIQQFVPWKLYPKNGLREPDSRPEAAPKLQTVVVRDHGGLRDSGSKSKVSFEAYCIQINGDGKCIVSLNSPLGANPAFTSLLQLFYAHSTLKEERYCSLIPLTIKDEPRFLHRGQHLDIARNIILPADVKKVLSGMWLNKMSRLRIHATDSQSWPIEIPSIPELAQKGAYHADQIWSCEALRDVQQYGYDRGIDVYLEIDMPGHTGSIYHSFPDLILAYNKLPWDKYAAEPPAGQLRLNSDKVHDFVNRILQDLLPRIAPFANVFNVGGDELNTNCYSMEEGIESNSKDVIRPFLQKFFDNIFPLLESHGLTPILWEEVLLEWDLKFPPGTVFQTWKSRESVNLVVTRGFRALFGPCHEWYLDLGFGTWIDPDPDNPETPIKYPYPDWCPPYKNWKRVYTYNPFEGVEEKNHHLILGGEMHLWCELTDAVSLEFMLWPRVAAGAELLWSGPGPVTEAVTRRLAEMRERLLLMGIKANVGQMLFSLQNEGSSLL